MDQKIKNYRALLLADSGSTKTEWVVLADGKPERRLKTQGLNPFFVGRQEIETCVRETLFPLVERAGSVAVRFYGAGCATSSQIEEVADALKSALKTDDVEVASDLLGAARALCGDRSGIACILGTGANSCRYDGQNIIANTPPLGYVLGDEGSGAYLGKRFLGDLMKGMLPDSLEKAFYQRYRMDRAALLNAVYKEPLPNRFLAHFAPFLSENIACEPVRRMVETAFEDFLQRNVRAYGVSFEPIHFVGSVAWHFKEQLLAAVRQCGWELGTVVAGPMEGLIAYHTCKNGKA